MKIGRQGASVGIAAQHSRKRVGGSLPRTPLAGQNLIQDAPERPDIGASVRRLPLRLLGTHVRGGSRAPCRLSASAELVGRAKCLENRRRGRGIGIDALARPKSSTFTRRRAELDVGGLEVAMDDPFVVRRLERLGNLQGDGDGLVDRHGPARAPRASRPRQAPGRALVASRLRGLPQAVDGRDVGMIERREQTRLTLEPFDCVTIVDEGLGEDLSARHRGGALYRSPGTTRPIPPSPKRAMTS